MRGPDSRAEMAATGGRSLLRGFFAPLYFPFSLFLEDRRRRRDVLVQKASVLMQRLSYPTETVLSNKITRD